MSSTIECTHNIGYFRVPYGKGLFHIRARCLLCGFCKDKSRWVPQGWFENPQALPIDSDPEDSRQGVFF